MRNLRELDRYRQRGPSVMEIYGWEGDDKAGAFVMPSPIDRGPMIIVASSDMGWDHVSVSRKGRCPNWAEMEHVKRAFFRDDETAMQLHVPASDHVNNHPFTLHLWRPLGHEIPRPPSIFVGIGNSPLKDAQDARLMHQKALRELPPAPDLAG